VQFGWVTLIGGIFYGSGVFLNARRVNIYGINVMLKLGATSIALSGVVLLLLWLLQLVGFWFVIMPIMFFIFGASLIFPNAYAGALIPFHKIAGISGAIAGFMQVLGGAVASGITSVLPDNTPLPLAIAFILCGTAIFVMVRMTAGQANNT
jgi:DHA1 family bicyclomycin/chloramphenicol resistance-like MFS transporter